MITYSLPPPKQSCGILNLERLTCLEQVVQFSFKQVIFWCLILESHLTTYHVTCSYMLNSIMNILGWKPRKNSMSRILIVEKHIYLGINMLVLSWEFYIYIKHHNFYDVILLLFTYLKTWKFTGPVQEEEVVGSLEIQNHEDLRNKFKTRKLKSTQWKAIDWKGDLKTTRTLWEVAEWVISSFPSHVGMS